MGKKGNTAYIGTSQKGFTPALKQLILREFPSLMGPKVADLFVSEVEKLIEQYYPKKDKIGHGQCLWYAVAKDEKPSYGKRMEDTRLVPVILNLITNDEIKLLLEGQSLFKRRKQIIARLFNEAEQQGGVLTEADVSLIIGRSIVTISKLTKAWEEEKQVVLPRRGTLHDMGRSLSHKKLICRKRVIEKKSTDQIARETNHTHEAVEIYTNALKRVSYCLRKGLTAREASFVTSMSENLTNEYVDIYKEMKQNKDSDEIPF